MDRGFRTQEYGSWLGCNGILSLTLLSAAALVGILAFVALLVRRSGESAPATTGDAPEA
ncbi:MAG TPA: hypothetical protein VKG44_03675 [Candidatus Baltobacteraceae bacterium]|nr:hypothetical protein [Candidatus Baltobacteraceae bacterium]